MASIRSNTSKEYPCLLCGTLGNIIRESDDETQRRIKCNDPRCGFVYAAKDSVEAKEAGVIPNGPRTSESSEAEAPQGASDSGDQSSGREAEQASRESTERRIESAPTKAPRTPSFVILSKDRLESEFCTKKNLKQRVIQWTASDRKYDVFELTPKKVAATLSIQ